MPETSHIGERNALTPAAFDKLLVTFDAADRDAAGAKYLELRENLRRFFTWRGTRFPDDNADETLNRAARKLEAVEKIMKARLNEAQKTELVRLVIADSKDLAYDFGNFTIDYDTADKQYINFSGSYLRVWRKIKGEWKSEAFFARPNEEPNTAAKTK